MKFSLVTVLSTLALLAASAHGQPTYIGSPSPGISLHGGEEFTVQVVRRNDPQGSQEVGLAISLLSCPEPNPCASPQSELGYVLYKGPYDPEQQGVPEPFQNFTVTVPSGDDFKGRAQLSVVRFHLNSRGPAPQLEFHNLTLTVL